MLRNTLVCTGRPRPGRQFFYPRLADWVNPEVAFRAQWMLGTRGSFFRPATVLPGNARGVPPERSATMAVSVKERSSYGAGFSTAPFQPAAAPPAAAPATGNICVVPRCELKFEKCTGGFRIRCKCPDEVSCATLQNLCRALCDGMCSCVCTWNGIQVCNFNLCCGHCQCENTSDGCCITCTSGDKACCEMLQACCECLRCCCESGCCCYVCFGGTPCCCGTC